jgi:hypothetical protein
MPALGEADGLLASSEVTTFWRNRPWGKIISDLKSLVRFIPGAVADNSSCHAISGHCALHSFHCSPHFSPPSPPAVFEPHETRGDRRLAARTAGGLKSKEFSIRNICSIPFSDRDYKKKVSVGVVGTASGSSRILLSQPYSLSRANPIH